MVRLPGRSGRTVEPEKKEVERMTGKEIIDWIRENHAEDMDILCMGYDGLIVQIIDPEIRDNAEIKEEYWECGYLPDEGRSVIL